MDQSCQLVPEFVAGRCQRSDFLVVVTLDKYERVPLLNLSTMERY